MRKEPLKTLIIQKSFPMKGKTLRLSEKLRTEEGSRHTFKLCPTLFASPTKYLSTSSLRRIQQSCIKANLYAGSRTEEVFFSWAGELWRKGNVCPGKR